VNNNYTHNELLNQDFLDSRLENEIKHGRVIAGSAGQIWNWESPAGKRRWERRVAMLTNHISPEMVVLELGCGTGYYTSELEKTRARITAIDISPELLSAASSKVKSDRVTFKLDNAYEMSFENETFDTVVGISVLHHLEIDKALKEIYRILKPRGSIRFSEPNMLNPQIAMERNIPYLRKKLGNSPDETAFFKWEIRNLLIGKSFSNVSVIPFDFLHPAIPKAMVSFFERMGYLIEKMPFLREIAGSLYITAVK